MGLSTVAGSFELDGGTVVTSGNLSINSGGQVTVGNNSNGNGGSLTIGGNLANSGQVNVGAASTATVNGSSGLSNLAGGAITLTGSAGAQATLNAANAAAGFGAPGVETGAVTLHGNALLEFASGQINTINGAVTLDGANARIADALSTNNNSALTSLSTLAGSLDLENGASVFSSGNLSMTSGASLTIHNDGAASATI